MATRTTRTLANLALLTLVLAVPASAQTFRGVTPYIPADTADYGFAGDFVRGSYIGAPLTRVPRPTQIVPSPWSYGTYGIPTVTGIAAPPSAQPTLTVINGGNANGRRHGTSENGQAGAQVIAVQVPRR